jgi:diguanylate cyclase (GGDEF)-like protein/PAS domain S-box-containing protein
MHGPSHTSEKKPRHEETLKDAEVLIDLVSRIGEGVYITNEEGAILDANPAMLAMMGVKSMEELRRIPVTEFIEPGARAEEVRLLKRDGRIDDFELALRRPDGSVVWVLDTAYAVKHPGGESVYRGIMRDITERRQLEQQLRDQSLRDPLTGAFNRRQLEIFEQRWQERGWGCIVFDVDHFKHYNDTMGHQAGDEILLALAHFLQRHTRADASLVRMGGDEFLVLLPHTQASDVDIAHQRIREAALHQAPIPISMGWAARENNEALEQTIHRADANLYQIRTIARCPNEERRRK